MFSTPTSQVLSSNSHLFRWHWYSTRKMVQNALFCLEKGLKHITTPYMESLPPNVFHDKAKRTQQENLLKMVMMFAYDGEWWVIFCALPQIFSMIPCSSYMLILNLQIMALAGTFQASPTSTWPPRTAAPSLPWTNSSSVSPLIFQRCVSLFSWSMRKSFSFR